MSNLVQRTITGIIFLIIVIGAITLGKVTFLILFTFILAGSMYEFYTLSQKDEIRPLKIYGILVGIIALLTNFLFANNLMSYKCFLLLIPLIIGIFIIELYRKSDQPFTNIGFTILGILYIAIPLSFANYIVIDNQQNYNPNLLLGFFFLMWSYDTLAYVFGISFGKHRLFERISPKKSWEGFIGGTLSSLGIAYIISLFFKELGFFDWAITALIVAIAGTFGDLVESSFKRSVDEKDSGKILPGHGGTLDRFDAVLLALPLFYLYLQFVQ
ncbi:MAG: hypothetical protein A2X13_08805 [Bacteroidetes bacterium GWC2_33_15]|nr:MAG: hypothetical protein A2X10_14700 [Bacteroidetes bacterium GWA2_33_15]OFX51351.1 MAG: hypothetical protein A2X13_08805 [Bacteroidetes bacterium GWC2_33_15]OFX65130.1 MAG: hypothetical protein A2X15_06970 [Bacteroidetes bacterium GWB2_32_14]OFX70727.1 MAG: hypothetical protein A2X14_11180 [Bacteroidetes bacterium GWD2_33_33]HAN18475.1 phosphatidate cytidylyltransferase [Bacteroidales bacterium]